MHKPVVFMHHIMSKLPLLPIATRVIRRAFGPERVGSRACDVQWGCFIVLIELLFVAIDSESYNNALFRHGMADVCPLRPLPPTFRPLYI